MTVLAAVLAAALTRAEIIDRMRAAPATRMDGLVQVIGDCPADMRREYMAPVASFVAGVCRSLYEMERIQPRRFENPGIVVFLGDERTNRTDLIVRERSRAAMCPYTYIRIPAPGFANVEALRRETAKAFYLAVKGERIGDDEATKALRRANPDLRAADEEAELAAWLEGRPVEGDDEKYLRMLRRVSRPGGGVHGGRPALRRRAEALPRALLRAVLRQVHLLHVPRGAGHGGPRPEDPHPGVP